MRTDGNICGGPRVLDPDHLVGSVFSNGSDSDLKLMKISHLKVQCFYMVLVLDGNSEHVAQRE